MPLFLHCPLLFCQMLLFVHLLNEAQLFSPGALILENDVRKYTVIFIKTDGLNGKKIYKLKKGRRKKKTNKKKQPK